MFTCHMAVLLARGGGDCTFSVQPLPGLTTDAKWIRSAITWRLWNLVSCREPNHLLVLALLSKIYLLICLVEIRVIT